MRTSALLLILLLLPLGTLPLFAQRPAPAPEGARLVESEGKVEISRRGAAAWEPARTNLALNPGDRVRTGERSRAVVRLSVLTSLRLDELTLLRIPERGGPRGFLSVLRGAIYFFHRDRPGEFPVQTPAVSAVIRGTEFNLRVAEDGTTRLTLIDGAVELSNAGGLLALQSGQSGEIAPDAAPRATARMDAASVIQWALYYPGVLDLADLQLPEAGRAALADALAAYREGDIPGALAAYPVGRPPASDDERLFFAAVLLSAGQVERSEAHLDAVAAPEARVSELRDALRRVIHAVRGTVPPSAATVPHLGSSLLAASYEAQSRSHLVEALRQARAAAQQSPGFAFAWSRSAELEFSRGHVGAALAALERSLELAPRNAEAHALRGFLLAARHEMAGARAAFDHAIALDGALGQAWLGRGLCRIRAGDAEGGREDLQVAATLEPQRALFRSYLGKAFAHADDIPRAERELQLARELDAKDPTAWLYSALLRQQQNRVNEAIRDLERSQDLNENRSLYRSRLLLDEDAAVRGANLASIYRDAGLTDVSVREAARAVSRDYANFSAHLFLADSFNQLRDPAQINLRYETPWFSEYLLANLLAPAAAGTLSPQVTQQEYARLFERNRLGLSSDTEYLSRGAWTQSGVQWGVVENFGYAAEVAYHTDPGQHRNGDLEQFTASLKLKYDLTPDDSFFLQGTWSHAESGDVRQLYNPAQADPTLRTKETLEPLVLAGFRHRWRPGVDTLVLGGYADDTLDYDTEFFPALFQQKNAAGEVTAVLPGSLGEDYRSHLRLYTAELQQVIQQNPHTVIVGGRYQAGEVDTRSRQSVTHSITNPAGFAFPASWIDTSPQDINSSFDRLSFYGYYHLQVFEPLTLIAGVSYDRVTAPENFRIPPLSEGHDTTDQVSPKAGLVWTPGRGTTIRAAYAQSLGGVSFDQSFRLEPSQIAGFHQAFRSLIPESVAGANAAARFETWGVALDQKLPGGTYLGLAGAWLESGVRREVGAFDFPSPVPATTPFFLQSGTREKLDYRERELTVTLNQLLGDEWAVGARYRLSYAELADDFQDNSDAARVPDGPLNGYDFQPRRTYRALLNQVELNAFFNHPSGFFSQFQALWSHQDNQGASGALADDDFWQFNLHAGWRFWQRRLEARVGVLNLGDQDYRLNPLNLMTELPRQRTFVAGLRFNF